MTFLLPKYRKLLPLSHYTFIKDAVKHEKTINNITVCLKITNTKQKKIYIEIVDHGKVTETYVAEILQNKIYCDKFIYLKTSMMEFI